MLICPLDHQNSLQILFFSDSLCLQLAKSCLITQLSSFLFIMAYFVQNKIGIFKKNKHVVIYSFTTSTQNFYPQKNYFKVDQKFWNETWRHTFCAGKNPPAP